MRLTACVTCVWDGVDSAWEKEKLEAWKMSENAADRVSELQANIAQTKRIGAWHPHASGARFVRRLLYSPMEDKEFFLAFHSTFINSPNSSLSTVDERKMFSPTGPQYDQDFE